MKIIGITGPTGAGKTTALKALQALGADVVDADAVYHRLLEESKSLKKALTGAFGEEILDKMGKIDRRRLSQAVYPDRLGELNALTHPIIVAEIRRLTREAEAQGRPAVAIDAIALVESGLARQCDVVVAVLAPLELRVRRIMARDGIDEDYARRRALAQKGEDFFRSHSDCVLENSETDTPEAFGERTLAFFQEILATTASPVGSCRPETD